MNGENSSANKIHSYNIKSSKLKRKICQTKTNTHNNTNTKPHNYTNCTGSTSDFLRLNSLCGMGCQLNCIFQSKPPIDVDLALEKWYLRFLSFITSIIGATTFVSFSAILSNNGSNQPVIMKCVG